MATSGVITGTANVRQIIRASFELLGIHNIQDADSYAMAMRHLNWMLKSMQTDGANLWRVSNVAINFSADQSVVTLSPNVVEINDARYVQSSSFERKMARYEFLGEYQDLPNKLQTGSPVIYSFQKQTGAAKLYLWPVPTEACVINATVSRIIEDVTDLDENIDVPQEYTDAVIYNLAARMVEPFGIIETQPNTAKSVKSTAAALYERMINADRPSSVYMRVW